MTDVFSIAGRQTIVTGGTSGIGRGVARHFVEHGADVVITGRRQDGANIAEAIGAQFVSMDVGRDDSVRDGLQRAVDRLGGLDVLILNAGIARPCGPLPELDMDAFRAVLEVNLFGVVRGLRFGLPHMAPGGVVIATSSAGGSQALAAPGAIAYSASKAALDMVMRSAGLEMAAQGIRVAAVIPGFIRTDIAGGTGHDAWLAQLTASGHARDPADMAAIYHYIASDAGSMVQASVVAADDGCTAGLSAAVLRRLMVPGQGPVS